MRRSEESWDLVKKPRFARVSMATEAFPGADAPQFTQIPGGVVGWIVGEKQNYIETGLIQVVFSADGAADILIKFGSYDIERNNV